MKWKWNYEEMGALLRGEEMHALIGDRIDKAAGYARSIAPVGGKGDPHPGLYRDSFETDVSVGVGRDGQRHTIGRLRNNAPYAAAIEYGNGNVQAHHVLSRAIDLMRE